MLNCNQLIELIIRKDTAKKREAEAKQPTHKDTREKKAGPSQAQTTPAAGTTLAIAAAATPSSTELNAQITALIEGATPAELNGVSTSGEHKGDTPLMVAAEKGDVETVRSLLGRGVKDDKGSNKDGQTALHIASTQGHPEVVRALLAADKPQLYLERHDTLDKGQRTARCGKTALAYAIQFKHLEVITLLLEAGANPNTVCCEDPNMPALVFIAGSAQGVNPDDEAKILCQTILEPKVQTQADSKATPPPKTGAQPPLRQTVERSTLNHALRFACINNLLTTAVYLRSKGADINEPYGDSPNDRQPILALICTRQDSEALAFFKEFLEPPASIQGESKATPPLCVTQPQVPIYTDALEDALKEACKNDLTETVIYLVRNGANPNISFDIPREHQRKPAAGYKPLACAIETGNVELVTKLMELGANPNLFIAIPEHGRLMFDWAMALEFEDKATHRKIIAAILQTSPILQLSPKEKNALRLRTKIIQDALYKFKGKNTEIDALLEYELVRREVIENPAKFEQQRLEREGGEIDKAKKISRARQKAESKEKGAQQGEQETRFEHFLKFPHTAEQIKDEIIRLGQKIKNEKLETLARALAAIIDQEANIPCDHPIQKTSNFDAVFNIFMKYHAQDVLVTPTGKEKDILLHHAARGANKDAALQIIKKLSERLPYTQLHAKNAKNKTALDVAGTQVSLKAFQNIVHFSDYAYYVTHFKPEYVFFKTGNDELIAQQVCAKIGLCKFLEKPPRDQGARNIYLPERTKDSIAYNVTVFDHIEACAQITEGSEHSKLIRALQYGRIVYSATRVEFDKAEAMKRLQEEYEAWSSSEKWRLSPAPAAATNPLSQLSLVADDKAQHARSAN